MEQKDLRDLIRLFDKSSITELSIREGEFSIKLKKQSFNVETPVKQTPIAETQPQQTSPQPQQISATPAQEAPQPKEAENIVTINSPMVGTFYRAPSPDAAPFVNVGDTVRKGQTIAIIEAMKIMNELEAEFDCKILEILVENGQPVEYDMPLFRVEKL